MPEPVPFIFVMSNGERVEAHRHRNPDGTIGGWVADNAKVSVHALVETGAIVGPRARVRAGRIVHTRKYLDEGEVY